MTRGRPFAKGASGDPAGKPRGARHGVSLAAEAILDGDAGELTRKAVELAKAGDTTALRICMERILPPRKDRPIAFHLRPIETAADASAAMSYILSATAAGKLTPIEAGEVCKIVEIFVRALEANDLERRLRALETGGLVLLPEGRK